MTEGPQPLFPLSQGPPEGHQPQSSYPQVGTQRSAPVGRPRVSVAPKLWVLAAMIGIVVIAMTVTATLMVGGSDPESTPTTRAISADPGYSDDDDAGSGERTSQRTNGRTDSRPETTVDGFSAPPPPFVREPDTFGEVCASGFQVEGRSGWGTRSGRGSNQTSCFFARSVLHAYWDQHGQPDETIRVVVAEGTVPCGTTGGECSADRFVMRCAVLGRDTWITCSGGKNARVYIF